MKYLSYTSNDFALDPDFQQWILNPDDSSNRFWNDWISQNPGKQKEVAAAVQLAKQLGPGRTIVTILCDSGTRYQSRLFNREWLAAKQLLPD